MSTLGVALVSAISATLHDLVDNLLGQKAIVLVLLFGESGHVGRSVTARVVCPDLMRVCLRCVSCTCDP